VEKKESQQPVKLLEKRGKNRTGKSHKHNVHTHAGQLQRLVQLIPLMFRGGRKGGEMKSVQPRTNRVGATPKSRGKKKQKLARRTLRGGDSKGQATSINIKGRGRNKVPWGGGRLRGEMFKTENVVKREGET